MPEEGYSPTQRLASLDTSRMTTPTIGLSLSANGLDQRDPAFLQIAALVGGHILELRTHQENEADRRRAALLKATVHLDEPVPTCRRRVLPVLNLKACLLQEAPQLVWGDKMAEDGSRAHGTGKTTSPPGPCSTS